MRQPRLRAPVEWGVAHYHVVSRVVDRRHVFGPAERDRFVVLMRQYERLCGVRILSYAILANHFHLLIEVPRRPPEPLTEAGLLGIVRRAYGSRKARQLREELDQARTLGGDARADAIVASWAARMWDLSAFMKALKQRFTQWFNGRHRRKGTLWEERFRSTLVEGREAALRLVSAYIDLNPVRAGLVDDPKDYRWSGYGEAQAGGRLARAGLRTVLDGADLTAYRLLLYGVGGECGQADNGGAMRRGFDRAQVLEVLRQGGRLSASEYLRCRVRYFTDGVAIGSRDYVEGVFRSARGRFSATRETGARRLRALADPLFALRNLRLRPIT